MRRIFSGMLLAGLCLLCKAGEPAAYPDRVSGDAAFENKDYPAAASFYARYRTLAHAAGDLNAERDALERRIDSLILSGMADQADALLQEYLKQFPGKDSLSSSMWQADIQFLRKKPEETIRILERIMPGLTLENPRRLRAVFLLGKAYEAVGNLEGAAKAYQSIYTAENLSAETRNLAFGRAVYCLAMSNNPDRALEELFSAPESMNPVTLQFLTILAHLRTEGPDRLTAAWLEASANAKKTPDVLLYSVCSSIGDSAARAGSMEMAAEAYRCAYDFASEKAEAVQSLQRLMSVLDLSGQTARSAALAKEMLRLFSGPCATPEMRLGAARILARAGESELAVELYSAMRQDPGISEKMLEDAMRECVYLYHDSGNPEKAEALIQDFFQPKSSGEAAFLRADLQLRSGHAAEAARLFLTAADAFPEKRSVSLYQAAAAFIAAGDFVEGMKVVESLAKSTGPEVQYAGYLRALVLELSGEPEKALPEYAAFLRTEHPDKPEFQENAIFRAGYLSAKTGQTANAHAYFARLLREFPQSVMVPAACFWRVYLLCMDGDFMQAEHFLWLLAEKYPADSSTLDAISCMANFYVDSGDPDRAFELLDSLQKQNIDPVFRQKILLDKAWISFRLGKFQESSRTIAGISQSSPYRPDADYLSGEINRQLNSFEKALDFYRAAGKNTKSEDLRYSARSAEADTLFTLAAMHDVPDFYRMSERIYKELLNSEKRSAAERAMLLFKLGKVYAACGEYDSAVQTWKEACHLPAGWNSPLAREWVIRSAEGICTLAETVPLKSMREAAADALHLLQQYQILSAESVDARLKALKKKRIKP